MPPGNEELITITAPHFCAGMVVENGHIIRIAPIIKYMKPWTLEQVKAYCKQKGWDYDNN